MDDKGIAFHMILITTIEGETYILSTILGVKEEKKYL